MARPFLSLAHNKKNSSPSGCQGCHSYTRRTYNSRRIYRPQYFFSETGLTLEQAMGKVETEIPVAPVLTPFQHGKPFITEEEEKSLGTQMFNLHRWYLRMAKDEWKMFGVKYRDHDFFREEDDFWVYFQNYITFTIDKPSTPLSSPFGFCKYHLPLH